MIKYYYIGAFPPKWGGVTIKNRDLYDALYSSGLEIKALDLNFIKYGRSIKTLWTLCRALFDRNSAFVIGISANSRRKLTRLLYFCNRKAMARSLLIIMGGAAARDMEGDISLIKWMSNYRTIYAETKSMMYEMQKLGLTNVNFYPNCRYSPINKNRRVANNRKLKCVFFSYIHYMKGVMNIIEAAKLLPDVDFIFYGTIHKDIASVFSNAVDNIPNIVYLGNFEGKNESVYDELAKYDILLFPTKYKTEGIPGIIVEAKIAGLAVIASNESFNSELVNDGKNGIILHDNNVEELVKSIDYLDDNREILLEMKNNSKKSAEDFYIENYIDLIKEDLIK